MQRQVTVTEHLLFHQKQSLATGRFTSLLSELILSAKIISREVTKAGLVDVLGFTGDTNVQGEKVKKLDEFANSVIIHRMRRSGVLCAMASEESGDLIQITGNFPTGDYILIFDPLDGSSNIDVNVSIGTIFSIYRRPEGLDAKDEDCCPPRIEDVLQKCDKQLAAGYFIYGSSTMMVFTTGDGVHGFTLDPSVGEFLLSHPDMKIPKRGKIYSVNESYWNYWDNKTKDVITYFKGTDNALGKPYTSRYIGTLVSDFHRNLLYGGIFMYPATYKDGTPRGKLRLTCEAAPMAMIVTQAGGGAIDGVKDILDYTPTELHQRVPLFIGSHEDVEDVRRIMQGELEVTIPSKKAPV
jgi:fructose-1,6-bisphosphatase I